MAKHVFVIEYDDETKSLEVQGPTDPIVALGMLSRVQLLLGEQFTPGKPKSDIVVPQVQVPKLVL